jgi:hypothetical protein
MADPFVNIAAVSWKDKRFTAGTAPRSMMPPLP